MDRVHSKEECRDESQAWVFKHAAFTCVHEQAGYGEVQTHIDDVEIQRRHAAQHDVQPDRQERKIFSTVGWGRIYICGTVYLTDLFMCKMQYSQCYSFSHKPHHMETKKGQPYLKQSISNTLHWIYCGNHHLHFLDEVSLIILNRISIHFPQCHEFQMKRAWLLWKRKSDSWHQITPLLRSSSS